MAGMGRGHSQIALRRMGCVAGFFIWSGLVFAQTLELEYSSYLGGSSVDDGNAVTVDTNGCIYIAGNTFSYNFPVTSNAYQTNFTGGGGGSDYSDAFVSKFSPDGSVLIFSTYLGAPGDEGGADCYGIAVADDGTVYVTGNTAASNFPVTKPIAIQPRFGGAPLYSEDAFVSRLSADGSALLYSTFLGGTNTDYGYGICVDSQGYAFVTGYTYSTNFPVTSGAFQPSRGGTTYNKDAFVSRLSVAESNLVFSTYLGGGGEDEGRGIALENGFVYVAGSSFSSNFPVTPLAYQTTKSGSYDVVVTKLATNGGSLEYSTYIGGTNDDIGSGISVEAGQAYVVGYTTSTNFPVVNAYQPVYGGGSYDAWVSKLSEGGTGLVYSTYLGGSGSDLGRGIAVEDGCAYIAGQTTSTNFPKQYAYQQNWAGNDDVFVTKFSPAGSNLIYSTYLGGINREYGMGIAVLCGAAYVGGWVASSNFPVTAHAFQTNYGGDQMDAFVSKLFLTLPLIVSNVCLDQGKVQLHWTGGPDATQYVMRADALVEPSWGCVFTNLPLDPNKMFEHETSTSPGFYRVQAVR